MQNSNYNHFIIEKQIYNYWEKKNFFKPKKNNKKHFSIVIPPPNVTGSLHMGHALNNSLQDLLWRPRPESNWDTRICNPLRNLSATWPNLKIPSLFFNKLLYVCI